MADIDGFTRIGEVAPLAQPVTLEDIESRLEGFQIGVDQSETAAHAAAPEVDVDTYIADVRFLTSGLSKYAEFLRIRAYGGVVRNVNTQETQRAYANALKELESLGLAEPIIPDAG